MADRPEIHRNDKTNNCLVCHKLCISACSRCGEIFCSRECQTIGWQDHKWVCFEMPELIIRSPSPNVQRNRFDSGIKNDTRNGIDVNRHSNSHQKMIPSTDLSETKTNF